MRGREGKGEGMGRERGGEGKGRPVQNMVQCKTLTPQGL